MPRLPSTSVWKASAGPVSPAAGLEWNPPVPACSRLVSVPGTQTRAALADYTAVAIRTGVRRARMVATSLAVGNSAGFCSV